MGKFWFYVASFFKKYPITNFFSIYILPSVAQYGYLTTLLVNFEETSFSQAWGHMP